MTRYSAVARALHWVTAALVVGLLLSGPVMTRLPLTYADEKLALYDLHKSFGILVLLLTALRVGWRLANRPPPLPATMPGWQRGAARATHLVFYVLLIVMPLSGWIMVSASPWATPTLVLGLVEWPRLPVSLLGEPIPLQDAATRLHRFAGYSFALLASLHVAAALKHHWIDRDDVLVRMWLTRKATR